MLTSEISADSSKAIDELLQRVEEEAKQRREEFRRLTQAQDRTQVEIQSIVGEIESVSSQLHHIEGGLAERLSSLENAMLSAAVSSRSHFLRGAIFFNVK